MWNLLPSKYNILISRDPAVSVFKTIDPNTTEQRKSRKLEQRKHIVKWANETWYPVGLDKLKWCGLPIQSAVDAYSHKVLWPKVC